MVVQKTALFPASKETVFCKLQQLKTLQYIAWPFAAFELIQFISYGLIRMVSAAVRKMNLSRYGIMIRR